MLSMHNEPQLAQMVLASGAHAFITKDQAPQTLLHVIHRVVARQRYIDPSLAEAIVFSTQENDQLRRYAIPEGKIDPAPAQRRRERQRYCRDAEHQQ